MTGCKVRSLGRVIIIGQGVPALQPGEGLFSDRYYAREQDNQKAGDCKKDGLRNFRAHLLGTDNREQCRAQKKAVAEIDQSVVGDKTQQCAGRGFVYPQHPSGPVKRGMHYHGVLVFKHRLD